MYFNFNNMLVYQVADLANIAPYQTVAERLASKPYRPLADMQMESISFYPINGELADEPIYALEIKNNSLNTVGILLTVCIAKKQVPSRIVKMEVEKRIAQLEEKGQECDKAMMLAIKEEVILRLSDKVLPQEKQIDVLLDLENDLVYIGVASANTAEKCFALIRQTLGSFPCMPFEFEQQVAEVLNKIFVKPDLSPINVQPKFRLMEYDEQTYSVSNNLTEYPLEYLQSLVSEQCLTTSQLEFAFEKGSYLIVAPKNLDNNAIYRGIKTHLKDLLQQKEVELIEDNVQSVQMKEALRDFEAEKILVMLREIHQNSVTLFS